MSTTTLFTGIRTTPLTPAERQLPLVSPEDRKDPAKYKTEPDLVAAVNVAMTLGMPLLITGEPGCGKSQLAYRLAWELGFGKKVKDEHGSKVFKANVEKFAVKSTTESGDLFYSFDTIGRFHASRQGDSSSSEHADARNFIHYQALGKAILNGRGQKEDDKTIMSDQQWEGLSPNPSRSIVLIDEIDKAPRDVPNDILNEIDDMAFSIPELQREEPITLPPEQQQYRPIVIITSNSERDLPEAFLRRCVFYHLGFPPFEQELDRQTQNPQDGDNQRISAESILHSQFPDYFADTPLRSSAIALMTELRRQADSYYKAPSMAEFINCFDFLFKFAAKQTSGIHSQQSFPAQFKAMGQQRLLQNAINQTLFKNHDDMQLAQPVINNWLSAG